MQYYFYYFFLVLSEEKKKNSSENENKNKHFNNSQLIEQRGHSPQHWTPRRRADDTFCYVEMNVWNDCCKISTWGQLRKKHKNKINKKIAPNFCLCVFEIFFFHFFPPRPSDVWIFF
jgi:hypothetical protein